MSVFLDTNVFAYAAELDEVAYDPCRLLEDGLVARRLGAETSVVVIEELWHLERRGRPRLPHGSAFETAALFGQLLAFTPETLDRAFALDAPPSLGSADRILVATCLEHGIGTIVTADAGFEGVGGLRRVDPLDHDAVDRLLGS